MSLPTPLPNFFEEEDIELPSGAQPYNPHQNNNEANSDSEETYSDSPPDIHVAQNINDIVFTNTAEFRSVLASLTNYSNGRLGHYLRSCKGLIIMPLEGVSSIRSPLTHHTAVFPCILFVPHQDLSHYQANFPNFLEALNILYQNKTH